MNTADFRDLVAEHQDRLPCRDERVNADDWFTKPGSQRSEQAKALCLICPLYHECRNYAVETGIPDGVWGGMDELQRENYWKANGGKPTAFRDELDAATLPMLQERRDFEHFDAKHSAGDEELEIA